MRKKTGKGRLVIITGPSGVGKDSVIEELQRQLHIQRVRTTTSRPQRPHDRPYTHVRRDQFRRMIAQGKFVEWAKVYGQYYGTTRNALRRALRASGIAVLANDPQGARTMQRQYPEALTIFLKPPSLRSLASRLRQRKQDSPDAIRRRLFAARKELRLAGLFATAIINRDGQLSAAVRQVRRFIHSAYQRRRPKSL